MSNCQKGLRDRPRLHPPCSFFVKRTRYQIFLDIALKLGRRRCPPANSVRSDCRLSEDPLHFGKFPNPCLCHSRSPVILLTSRILSITPLFRRALNRSANCLWRCALRSFFASRL